MSPYRSSAAEADREDLLWEELDWSLSRWSSHPSDAVFQTIWVWRDARRLGFSDLERAADAFLVCMAPSSPRF